jgi:hypothetical protein
MLTLYQQTMPHLNQRLGIKTGLKMVALKSLEHPLIDLP